LCLVTQLDHTWNTSSDDLGPWMCKVCTALLLFVTVKRIRSPPSPSRQEWTEPGLQAYTISLS